MKKLIVIFILVFSSIGFSDNITDKLDEAFYYKEAGFLLKDFYEDTDPDDHLGQYTNIFAATLAVKM